MGLYVNELAYEEEKKCMYVNNECKPIEYRMIGGSFGALMRTNYEYRSLASRIRTAPCS